MADEKVSVALCTFNGARFLQDQLTSLARQTRRPDEVVISDDASHDATLEIARATAAETGLSCVFLRNESNAGFASNFARAASHCTGDYVFFCDQDDVWLPEKIERHLEAFRRKPATVLVASDSSIVDEALASLGQTQLNNCHFGKRYRRRLQQDGFRVFLSLRPIPGHAMAVRNSVLQKILPVPRGWPHDGWTCLLASAIGPVEVLPEALTLYRRHQAQSVGALQASPAELAKQMGPGSSDPFETEVQNLRTAAQRLQGLGEMIPQPIRRLRDIDAKIRLLTARAEMKKSPGKRWKLIGRELLSRRYFHLAQGWLSVGRDVLGK